MNYIPYLIRTRIVEVVTDTVQDQLNDPYSLSNEEDRQELQQELLELSEDERNILQSFLISKEFATEYVMCLAYAASEMVHYNVETVDLEKPAEHYNARFLIPNSKAPIHKGNLKLLMDIDNLKDEFFATASAPFRYKKITRMFLLYGILSRCSIWSLDSSIGEILVAKHRYFGSDFIELMNYLCDNTQMDAIIDEVLPLIPEGNQSNQRSPAENLLLDILFKYNLLFDYSLWKIVDRIFPATIGLYDIHLLLSDKLLNCPRIRSYLRDKFEDSWERNDPKPLYADAYALRFRWPQHDPIKGSLDTILTSKDPQRLYLALSVLSTYGWARVFHYNPFDGDPLLLTKELNEKLVSLLLHKDPRIFKATVRCLEDLYVASVFDTTAIPPTYDIKEVALSMLSSSDEDLKKYAERLLGLFPMHFLLPEELFMTYEQQFEAMLEKPFDPHIIPVFRILLKNRFWEEEYLSRDRLTKLYEYFERQKEAITPYDYTSLNQATKAVVNWNNAITRFGETFQPAMELFLSPLKPAGKAKMTTLVEHMHLDPELSYTAQSPEDVALLCKYLHACDDPLRASILLERTEIACECDMCGTTLGSLLIVNLFYLYCFFQIHKKAIDMYRDFSAVLDRPAQHVLKEPFPMGEEKKFSHYYEYLTTLSRVESILYEMLVLGKSACVEAFADPSRSPLREKIRERIVTLLEDANELRSMYELEGLPVEEEESFIPTIGTDPAVLIQLFYDDRAVVLESLCELPDYHEQIIIGYSDDLTAADIAVKRRHLSYYLFDPALREMKHIQDIKQASENLRRRTLMEYQKKLEEDDDELYF